MLREASLRRRQTGAVAIIVALSLAALIGFAGLVLDLGRLFINKTELQNAADACALAAARELTCSSGPCPASSVASAQAAGIYVAARHNRDFQSQPVAIAPADIKFSTSIAPNSAYLSVGDGALPQSRFVMCTARSEGILPWFMGVLGIGAQSVSAMAVASPAPSRTNCAIPVGVCSPNPTPSMTVGEWFGDTFSSGGGVAGNFNWVEFPSSPPVSDLLKGTGMCDMSLANQVRDAPALTAAEARAFNSRFGLYASGTGNPQITDAPPDYTGYAYTSPAFVSGPGSWPAGSNAYNDFLGKRSAHAPYGSPGVADGNSLTGLAIGNEYDPPTQSGPLTSNGADRRMVVAPIVNCGGLSGSSTTPILAWACVLLLHPVANTADPVYFEYRGLASDTGSPCATSGTVGGPGSVGPLVPALVQ
ncbi:MAG: pilus assembly protein TadG-related protein [Rhodocyclaceae bacterium]